MISSPKKSKEFLKLLIEQARLLRGDNSFKSIIPIANLSRSKNFSKKFEKIPSGIRTCLVDKDLEFVRDFLIEEDEGSLHILNYASPGWTSALAAGEEVARRVEKVLGEENVEKIEAHDRRSILV